MSLDQLRELSDLQLSERELADVIEAIHNGGAEQGPADITAETQSEPVDCLLCKHMLYNEHNASAQCVMCNNSVVKHDVQSQLQTLVRWTEWYQQYMQWARSWHQAQPLK